MNSETHTFENGEGQGRHTVIVMQRVGRLGNQLALFANLVALSLATGVGISHPTLAGYARYFKGTASDLFCRFPKRRTRTPPIGTAARTAIYCFCRILAKSTILNLVTPKRTFESDYGSLLDMSQEPFLAKVFSGHFTFLTKGWFFRYPHVHKKRFLCALREFFALAEPYASNVERLVKKARAGCNVLIGVHIRQTDFKEHAGGKYYFSTADYAHLMRHCQHLFQPAKVGFLVVSDEPHNSSDFPSSQCSFGSGIDIEDMYCLGGCDYIIGSIASSYSLWPAVLFQKPTFRMASAQVMPGRDDFRLTMEPWINTSGEAI